MLITPDLSNDVIFGNLYKYYYSPIYFQLINWLSSQMEDEEVVLLSWWASVFSLRVKIALAEKGIDYNKKEEDLFNKSPILVKYNPVHKKVPVLIHNGKPICESLAIVEYIDEVWTSSPSLLPQDPYQRANARFWAGLTDKVRNIRRSSCHLLYS